MPEGSVPDIMYLPVGHSGVTSWPRKALQIQKKKRTLFNQRVRTLTLFFGGGGVVKGSAGIVNY